MTDEKKMLLLVDDNEEYRGSIIRLLERNGYEVIEADSVERAGEILRQRNIDAVLTDRSFFIENSGDNRKANDMAGRTLISSLREGEFGREVRDIPAAMHTMYPEVPGSEIEKLKEYKVEIFSKHDLFTETLPALKKLLAAKQVQVDGDKPVSAVVSGSTEGEDVLPPAPGKVPGQ